VQIRAQERMWFLDQLKPGNLAYNRPVLLHLSGQRSVTALEQSLNAIVCRHEVLHSIFPAIDGHPVQVITACLPLELPIVDLSHMPAQQPQAAAQRRLPWLVYSTRLRSASRPNWCAA
jgi:Condensation domain